MTKTTPKKLFFKSFERLCCIAFVLTISSALSPVSAQDWQFRRDVTPFPIVDENGEAYEHAFFGGLNTPAQQFLDIDGDSDPDLFIQDRANQLIFFRNTGSATAPKFEWESDAFEGIFAGGWFKFADVDLDNDFDLFVENPFGIIRYYQNTGTPAAPLFVISVDSLRDDQGQLITVDGPSFPEWADLYCANRLDLYLGRQSGYVTQYQLSGFDPQGVPVYTHITDEFEDILILTGGGLNISNNPRHGANSLSFLDIDNDGDSDLFWGDFFATSMIFIENTGDCTNPEFDIQNIVSSYPPQEPVNTGGYNIPRFADIDGDSDFDMFVSVFGGVASFVADKAANFHFYENTGTVTTPQFVRRTRDFVNSVDIGQNAVPVLADIDADGDPDLFLANQEDVNAPSQSNSRLFFWENTGTASAPAFVLRSRNYLNYDRPIFDSNYAPVFIDIDADGDLDLFLGNWDGKINFWRNDGTATQPQLTRIENNYGGIDVGNNSTPAFADIDADGDFDLFIGEAAGVINFYRNTGTPDAAVFELVTQEFAGINLGFQQYTYPRFVDADGDGDPDLFVGSETRGTLFYRNQGTPQIYDLVPDPTFSLPQHLRIAPNPVDIDGDGDLDLVIGVNGGGMVFYENLEFTVGINPRPDETQPTGFQLLANYPNPFNPETKIRYWLANNVEVKLKIYNVLGKSVRTLANGVKSAGWHETTWDGFDDSGKAVASGIYFYRLEGKGIQQTRRMLLLR